MKTKSFIEHKANATFIVTQVKTNFMKNAFKFEQLKTYCIRRRDPKRNFNSSLIFGVLKTIINMQIVLFPLVDAVWRGSWRICDSITMTLILRLENLQIVTVLCLISLRKKMVRNSKNSVQFHGAWSMLSHFNRYVFRYI